MSTVDQVALSHSASTLAYAPRTRVAAPAPEQPVSITLSSPDSVDFSAEARAAEGLQGGNVQRVRQALAEGTYLNPDKLDIAIDRLLADLNRQG